MSNAAGLFDCHLFESATNFLLSQTVRDPSFLPGVLVVTATQYYPSGALDWKLHSNKHEKRQSITAWPHLAWHPFPPRHHLQQPMLHMVFNRRTQLLRQPPMVRGSCLLRPRRLHQATGFQRAINPQPKSQRCGVCHLLLLLFCWLSKTVGEKKCAVKFLQFPASLNNIQICAFFSQFFSEFFFWFLCIYAFPPFPIFLSICISPPFFKQLYSFFEYGIFLMFPHHFFKSDPIFGRLLIMFYIFVIYVLFCPRF